MASAVATQKLFSRLKIEAGAHVPTNTGAQIATGLVWVPLRDYDAFAVIARPVSVASNGITLLEIVAAVDINGVSATQIKTTGAVVGNAVTYYYALEASAEEIEQIGRAAGLAFTHVAARVTCDNANSTVGMTYVRGLAKMPHLDLTASVVS